jgi:hypothetical protein
VAAWSTVFSPARIDRSIVAIVFLLWMSPNRGVTGTARPDSTICLANGATSGSADVVACCISAVVPGK